MVASPRLQTLKTENRSVPNDRSKSYEDGGRRAGKFWTDAVLFFENDQQPTRNRIFIDPMLTGRRAVSRVVFRRQTAGRQPGSAGHSLMNSSFSFNFSRHLPSRPDDRDNSRTLYETLKRGI